MLPEPAVTAVAIVPVPEIVPCVNVIGRVRAVVELYFSSAPEPLIVIPLVPLIRPAEPISSRPPAIVVEPV